MKMFYRLFFLFFVLMATKSFAADQATTDLIQLLNQVKSIKANFVQTLFDKRGRAGQKTFGHMALQRPGKFRWDITKPQPQIIIANENKLWIYDPDLEQLTIRPLLQATGETPALLLSHDDASLEKHYIVTSIQKNQPGWRWFSLASREKDSLFKTMEMGFLNNELHEMRLQDNLGHTTAVKFQDIQTNINLPASLFSLKPPANVDIIDETRKRKR